MRRITFLQVLLCTAIAVLVLFWPADAQAQRGRRAPVRVVRPVVVGSFFYGPFYDPFFWGAYGWYPSPYWYPYPQFPPYPGYGAYDGAAARIQVTPRETEVYVDGYFVGVADDFDGFAQRLRVAPGEHEIALYLNGYRAIHERVLFRPGATLKIKHTMERVAPGEASEPRPQPSESAPPSRRPPPGTPPPPPPSSERAPERSTFGTLSIRVQPSGATVLVDGERWEGPEGQNRLMIDVAEGTHRIEVQLEGYRPYSTEARVRRGEVTTVNVSLSRQEQRP